MKKLGKKYTVRLFDGAGHGFLRSRPGATART